MHLRQTSLPVGSDKLVSFCSSGDWVDAARFGADGAGLRSGLRFQANSQDDPFASWWGSYLQGGVPTRLHQSPLGTLRFVDLFCSVGGLSLGFSLAAEVLGHRAIGEFAADSDPAALEVYRRNMLPSAVAHTGVQRLVDFDVRADGESASFVDDPYLLGRAETKHLEGVDVLLAGPPCQGHSTLNNHTRSNDPRNGLYLTVPAIAIAARIPLVVIENVPNVVNDRMGVVDATKGLLANAGYNIQDGVIDVSKLGWPQTRKRYFLFASLMPFPFTFSEYLRAHARQSLPLSWAIGDIADRANDSDASEWDRSSRLSVANQERVDWLLADDSRRNLNHDLRPVSHQRNPNYPAVYGKMNWDGPSGTITGGFLSPGRGRFTHPRQARGLTPHEGARIQGFPDSFDFMGNAKPASRTAIAQWIGNAVPPVMGFFAGVYVLSSLSGGEK